MSSIQGDMHRTDQTTTGRRPVQFQYKVDRKLTANSNQKKYSGKPQRREQKLSQDHEAESKSSLDKSITEPADKSMVMHYKDGDNTLKVSSQSLKPISQMSEKETREEISVNSSDLEKEEKKQNGEPDSDEGVSEKNNTESSEGELEIIKSVKVRPNSVDSQPVCEVKVLNVLDEASNITQNNEKEVMNKKMEEMEMRIEKLEEELREVAALEISLYSVVPEHGSSAHKVHTSARRLSRLYIHACKYWSLEKRATVAKNTVSGLILVAKSSSNDVPRLSFWLSNTVVLREIISQAFGNSCSTYSSFKWKGNSSGCKQTSKQGLMHFIDDWQETSTFTAALEKVESWIFSRIVESIWWQAFAPNMQSPIEGSSYSKMIENSGDHHKNGSYSIDLWKSAFEDAMKRLCPVRAGGHECGCLPALLRKVMEQCVARLDVAMFNAILRESANEIPTDPLSDPIVDPNVLPISAGDLSFSSGAQLKNAIGNWSRLLIDLFGASEYDSSKQDEVSNSHDDIKSGNAEPKHHLQLLSALSDLLMLPKDMVMDRSVREELCPSIGLPLIKRILCNFTPDELCPDHVPGSVLEALNAECLIEQRRLSGDSAGSCFPYRASPVVYIPPNMEEVAEKVAEAGAKSSGKLSRNASVIQRKGYTSDDELEELKSPITSFIDNFPSPSPSVVVSVKGKSGDQTTDLTNGKARYQLLREVWMS